MSGVGVGVYSCSADCNASVGNIFVVGKAKTIAANANDEGFLTAAEAKGIDEKIDDGNAKTGNVTALSSTATSTTSTCTGNGSPVAVGEYQLAGSSSDCAIFFRLSQ